MNFFLFLIYNPFFCGVDTLRPCRSQISRRLSVILVKSTLFVSSLFISPNPHKSGTDSAKSPLSYNSFAHSNGFLSLSGVTFRIYHKGKNGSCFTIFSLYFSAYEVSKSISCSFLSFTVRYGDVKTSSLLSVK